MTDAMSPPQFTLYSNNTGPNGHKVAIILRALGLTYTVKYLSFDAVEQKASPFCEASNPKLTLAPPSQSPEYLKLNPNGRIPTLHDNTSGFVIWESAAIMTYLCDKYDTARTISAENEEDRALQLQWLAYSVSGQGPYFGQWTHFSFMHPTKLPTAIVRYRNEIDRVLGVLELILETKSYLVADKPTIADLVFFSWNDIIFSWAPETRQAFPVTWAWHQRLAALPYVAAAMADKQAQQEKEEKEEENKETKTQ